MDTTRIVLRATARLYQRISAQLILLAAFVGLLWFLVYFTVNSSFAIRVFDGTVNTFFRGRVAWSRITWGPMPWQLEILEPVLIGAHDRPIITAGAIQIDEVRLVDLLSGRVAANGITIDRPVVRLTGRMHPEAFDDLGHPKLLLDLPGMFWPPGPLYDDGQPGGGVRHQQGAASQPVLTECAGNPAGLRHRFRVGRERPDRDQLSRHRRRPATDCHASGP